MKLDPERYECPDHHVDVTDQVSDALENHGPPVAYLRGREPRQFRVIVRCPGQDGAGEHSLTCTGTWSQ